MPITRIEVGAKEGLSDPLSDSLVNAAAGLGIRTGAARTRHVYLIEGDLSPSDIADIRERLLTDPVTEQGFIGVSEAPPAWSTIEVHPLPGVMDPVAQSVELAIGELTGCTTRVSTGWRYDLAGVSIADAMRLAERELANPVIQKIHTAPYVPSEFPRSKPHEGPVRSIPILSLNDEGLLRLSRDAHLFLSLEEMRAVQSHFKQLDGGRGREPTDMELETLAQTWSEHCVHKTLKSTIAYRSGLSDGQDPIRWSGRPGHSVREDGTIIIQNLLKSTVAAATHELIKEGIDWTLSVFVDNAGVVAFDDDHAVCIKVETHNHPSAIEPYGGAATGAGGCIRDVIGTGLGARPIACTDVFCVAHPNHWSEGQANGREPGQSLPTGTLHPRRILTQVVAGVRDYGNRMGIPTVSGAVAFDDRYIGNPLVFCGCIGVMPRASVRGSARAGDRIVALGGRTGRDGIHGATFSSVELEHTSADEFSHAVQIGNAITEKQVLDAILRARDDHPAAPLFSAITDCGAGGFSSAIGEMGGALGAHVRLENAPLKYPGLSPTEIWISEAQERMVLAVPPEHLDALRQICREESVEAADLGEFGTPDRSLRITFNGTVMGELSMKFLHDGIPTPLRDASWPGPGAARVAAARAPAPALESALLRLLASPTIASKHWIIRQYDHEVRGNTVVRPLVGAQGRGPSDASVIQPVPGTRRGLAISQGLQTGIGEHDPYLMALAAIDECVRNLVCVGADPHRIAILDNFCWPSCAKPENLGALVRAAEGCYDGAKAYRTPFVSGKDSLNNQFTMTDPATGRSRTIEIPPTLLITGMGRVDDVSQCITSDAKSGGNRLILVGATTDAMGGSSLLSIHNWCCGSREAPRTDLRSGPRTAIFVADLIRRSLVRAAHDVSDGGALTAIAEMLIGGWEGDGRASLGTSVDLEAIHADSCVAAFSESPSRYILEVEERHLREILSLAQGVPVAEIGSLDHSGHLKFCGQSIAVEHLMTTWLHPLDW